MSVFFLSFVLSILQRNQTLVFLNLIRIWQNEEHEKPKMLLGTIFALVSLWKTINWSLWVNLYFFLHLGVQQHWNCALCLHMCSYRTQTLNCLSRQKSFRYYNGHTSRNFVIAVTSCGHVLSCIVWRLQDESWDGFISKNLN